MPLYEYQCEQCGRFEQIRKFSDPALTACPTCGKDVQKLLSAPAIQFKGTGWYITDYARKSGGNGTTKESSGESKAETKSESKSETKSESKSDSKSDSTPTQSTSKDSSASGSSPTK